MSNWGVTKYLATIGLMFAVGCTQVPTKTFTSEDIDTIFLQKALRRPLEISQQTVIVDARTSFEYAVVHAPNAVNLQWRDFCDQNVKATGVLKKDLSGDARRLALKGIAPETPVVVVGAGLQGQGYEGRVAWTLLYMGLKNVQTAQIDSLGLRYSNIETPPKENQTSWAPHLIESILVSFDEMKAIATMKYDQAAAGKITVLDVRTTEEIAQTRNMVKQKYSEFRTLNLPWTEFYSANGRPNFAVRAKLSKLGLGAHDQIVVISNRGVRSGAVTYALLTLGYKKAANYAGGFEELLEINR